MYSCIIKIECFTFLIFSRGLCCCSTYSLHFGWFDPFSLLQPYLRLFFKRCVKCFYTIYCCAFWLVCIAIVFYYVNCINCALNVVMFDCYVLLDLFLSLYWTIIFCDCSCQKCLPIFFSVNLKNVYYFVLLWYLVFTYTDQCV